MRLIIISGISGSGKSVALHALEDLDFYCIDNLPIGMLPALADQILQSSQTAYPNFAVGIDARNLSGDLTEFPFLLKDIRGKKLRSEVYFLAADDATLIKRFSETRRKHPLTDENVPLSEAIAQERLMLEPISSCADLMIDTSLTNIHQLRDLMRERVLGSGGEKTSLLIESFGFKHGIPVDADFVFDVRCLPNPHWIPELRTKTGLDEEVANYLEQHDDVKEMYSDIQHFLTRWIGRFEADSRSYLTVAIGCTGGQHRSVYMAEQITKALRKERQQVLVRHRELA